MSYSRGVAFDEGLILARRLERAEAMANAAFVDARREVDASVGAAWIEIAGTYAMFDGPDSPLTQTFGVGLFEPFGAREFDRAESFFSERAAATNHEVSSFASYETLSLLSSRGYSPIEASVVLVRDTSISEAARDSVRVRITDERETDIWAATGAQGWASEAPEFVSFMESLGAVTARAQGVSCFLAEIDGEPIAAATLHMHNGVALLAGASTIPSARRQGAQRALLDARLRFATDAGVELAMVVTQPGSASQRNAERSGFRPVYTRVKWQRATT